MNLKIAAWPVGLSLCLLSAASSGQDYPTRPVSVIVPFAAGGPTDTMARLLAQQFQASFKQTVVVENAPGAGGTIGYELLEVLLGFGVDDGDGVSVKKPYFLQERARLKRHNSSFTLGVAGRLFLLLFFKGVIFCYF